MISNANYNRQNLPVKRKKISRLSQNTYNLHSVQTLGLHSLLAKNCTDRKNERLKAKEVMPVLRTLCRFLKVLSPATEEDRKRGFRTFHIGQEISEGPQEQVHGQN